MRIFDCSANFLNVIKSLLIVIVCMTGLVWLYQQSLNRYWSLHFHEDSPWAKASSPLWEQGARVMRAALAAKETFTTQLSDATSATATITTSVIEEPSEPVMFPVPVAEVNIPANYPQNDRQLSRWVTTRAQAVTLSQQRAQPLGIPDPLYDEQGAAILPAGRKVLFIGDSMMESVAPWALKLLKDNYQAEGINLSRRSTGLAYPDSFNWPQTAAKALAEHADIGLLAVFLGPNDPWDMPVAKGLPYLKFGSEEWNEEYRSRIHQILALSEQYNVPVIWILPPNMKKEKLNRAMAALDLLYKSEVVNMGGIVIDVNRLFGYQDDIYSPFAMVDGKQVSVRSGDGIHYTLSGAKMIAREIVRNIHFISPVSENFYEE